MPWRVGGTKLCLELMTRHEFELIDAAKAGDKRALADLVEEYQNAVYRFGRAMCGSSEDAKDVLQETLITALQKVGEFRGDASFRTWLYTIARSHCSRKRRKGNREILARDDLEHNTREVADSAPLAADELVAATERSQVAAAIAELEPMYKEVLVLRDIEGLTAPEVAQTLGITVQAVKSRLHRARAKVRELLALALDSERERPPGCPDVVGMLSRSLEGELKGVDCQTMQSHVDSCPACKAECDALQRILRVCSNAGQSEVPPEVRAALGELTEQLRTRRILSR